MSDSRQADLPVACELPVNTETDYKALYEAEVRKNADLASEVEYLQVQGRIYARDLASVYRNAKGNRRELAVANTQLLKYAEDLRNSLTSLRRANAELHESYYDTIHRLALAAEYKDEHIGKHVTRMRYYCALLAEKLGLPAADIRTIYYASPMHDVGKIGIPDSIILKPSRLTKQEFSVMQSHTTIGSSILSNSKAEILTVAQQMALWHHEKWDGTGYPHGLAKDRIPVMCRIIALADVFDALTSQRPYKEAFSMDHARDVIRGGRETQFDPAIVDVFTDNIADFVKIMQDVNQGKLVSTPIEDARTPQ